MGISSCKSLTIGSPFPSSFSDVTRYCASLFKVTTKCLSMLKWKVGNKIVRRCFHLSPFEWKIKYYLDIILKLSIKYIKFMLFNLLPELVISPVDSQGRKKL